jgi:hypothetical protein
MRSEKWEVRSWKWKFQITSYQFRITNAIICTFQSATIYVNLSIFFLADQRWSFSRWFTLIYFLRPSAWTIFLIFFSRRSTLIYFLLIYADFFSASICVFNLRTSAWNNLWNILPLNFMDILHSFVGLRCAAAPDYFITFSFSTNIIAATQLHPSIVF